LGVGEIYYIFHFTSLRRSLIRGCIKGFSWVFAAIGSSGVKTVARKQRLAAHHKALATSFPGVLTSMTFNYLKPQNMGFW